MEAMDHRGWVPVGWTVRHALPTAVLGLMLSACGHVDCSSQYFTKNSDAFATDRPKDPNLARFDFKNSEDGPVDYSVKLDKIHQGYSLTAPVYADDGGLSSNIDMQKDKDLGWFSGMKLSFAF